MSRNSDQTDRQGGREPADWGVSMSNDPEIGPVETLRVASRRLWERRDDLF